MSPSETSISDNKAHLHDHGGVPDVHGELIRVPAQVRGASVWVNGAQHAEPVHQQQQQQARMMQRLHLGHFNS